MSRPDTSHEAMPCPIIGVSYLRLGDAIMADELLLEKVAHWLESRAGAPMSEMRTGPTPVVPLRPNSNDSLRALKIGGKTIVACRPEWVDPLQPIVDDLDPDLLFSMFGAYELARVTLRDGVGIWGPVWFLFADERTWRPMKDDRVVILEPSQLADVDYRFFWHCRPDSLAGFAIYDGDRLAALATVWDDGDPMWEIGMDVVQDAKLRGLGRAVVSAAARWILDNDRVALATTAQFNVPSARTLRSVGLRRLLTAMIGTEGAMNLAPQPLGAPFPGAETRNLYPKWAMNHDILPNKQD